MQPAQIGQEGATERAATLFAALWALAALFHLLAQPGPLAELGDPSAPHGPFAAPLQTATVGVAALLLLLRPDSLPRLLLLATLQLVKAVWLMPAIANHRTIEAFCNLALLLVAAELCLARRPLSVGTLLARAAPALRWVILLAYGFAAFSKLNRDFLDPEVSCAADFSAQMLGGLGLEAPAALGPVLSGAAILGTVAIGLAVPLRLLWRPALVACLCLALLFHFVLVVDPLAITYDFSSALYALFLLFLPGVWIAGLRPLVGFVDDERTAQRRRRWLAATIAVLLVGAATPAFAPLAVLHLSGRKLLWLLYAVVFLSSVALLVRRRGLRLPGGGEGAPFARGAANGRLPAATWPVLALVALNGMAPYLGLKTGTSFTMYSNLRTEQGTSNHLLVRRTAELLPHAGDLIAPLASNDPTLNQWAVEELLVSRLELRRTVQLLPGVEEASLRWREADGTVHRTERIADHPELGAPLPLWQRKLQLHRPVDAEGPMRCRW